MAWWTQPGWKPLSTGVRIHAALIKAGIRGGWLAGGWRCEKDDWLYGCQPPGNRACVCVSDVPAWTPFERTRLNRPVFVLLFLLLLFFNAPPNPLTPPPLVLPASSAAAARLRRLHNLSSLNKHSKGGFLFLLSCNFILQFTDCPIYCFIIPLFSHNPRFWQCMYNCLRSQ